MSKSQKNKYVSKAHIICFLLLLTIYFLINLMKFGNSFLIEIDLAIAAGLSVYLLFFVYRKIVDYQLYIKLIYVSMSILAITVSCVNILLHNGKVMPLILMILLITLYSIPNKRHREYFLGIYLMTFLISMSFSDLDSFKKIVAYASNGSIALFYFIYIEPFHHKSEAEVTLSRYEKILKECLYGSFAVNKLIRDENGRAIDYEFIEINDAFEKVTGLSKNKIIGKTVYEVLPNTESSLIEFYDSVVRSNQNKKYIEYSVAFDKYLEVNAYPLGDDSFITLHLDVTDEIWNQQSIEHTMSNLKEANTFAMTFMNNANHELRTPLNGLVGMLQLIDKTTLDPTQTNMFELIEEATDNLLNTLNKITKQAESNLIEYTYNEGYIVNIVDNIINRHKNGDIQLNTLYDIRCMDVTVFLQDALLKDVLDKLISIALATPQYKPIDIAVHSKVRGINQSEYLSVSVINYGENFPLDLQENLFNCFQHDHLTNISKTHENLTLSICRQLLLKNGGDLYLSNNEDNIITFAIDLPYYYGN